MDTKSFIRENVEKALTITPSVFTLARLNKIDPEVFAKAIVDKDADVDYVIAFTGALAKAQREVEKTEKKASK
jgi:hypothetical protein